MANPHSLLTLVRFRLARWVDPYPDKGEAWCMDCVLNGGRTLILNAAGHPVHVAQHRDAIDRGETAISIRVNYGQVRAEDL